MLIFTGRAEPMPSSRLWCDMAGSVYECVKTNSKRSVAHFTRVGGYRTLCGLFIKSGTRRANENDQQKVCRKCGRRGGFLAVPEPFESMIVECTVTENLENGASDVLFGHPSNLNDGVRNVLFGHPSMSARHMVWQPKVSIKKASEGVGELFANYVATRRTEQVIWEMGITIAEISPREFYIAPDVIEVANTQLLNTLTWLRDGVSESIVRQCIVMKSDSHNETTLLNAVVCGQGVYFIGKPNPARGGTFATDADTVLWNSFARAVGELSKSITIVKRKDQ